MTATPRVRIPAYRAQEQQALEALVIAGLVASSESIRDRRAPPRIRETAGLPSPP